MLELPKVGMHRQQVRTFNQTEKESAKWQIKEQLGQRKQ